MKENPVEEYLNEKEKTAARRREADTEAYNQWVQAGGLEGRDEAKPHFQRLMRRFNPAIRGATSKKPPGVGAAAYRLDLKEQAKKALQTWDPRKPGGANLNTWVTTHLRKSQRYGGRRANIAAIPEAPMSAIGVIDQASDQLTEELGRTPSPAELHSHFRARVDLPKTVAHELRTPHHIQAIQTQRRADIPASTFETDPLKSLNPRQSEVLSMIRPNLTPREQQVYDEVYSRGVTGTGAIARKLRMSEQDVSKLKTRILKKTESFM